MRKRSRVLIRKTALEALLSERNWYKQDFARLIRIAPSMLSHYLSHRVGVDVEIRERMLKALGVEWNALFFLEPISSIENNFSQDSNAA